MAGVITDIEQVTSEWLTATLRKNGFLKFGKVIAVQIKETKELFLVVIYRFEVVYSEDAPPTAPTKLFLKFSRPDLSRQISAETNLKEIEFYAKIAPAMNNASFIKCYDAAFSSESNKTHLLLEDLTETHFQPQTSASLSDDYCVKAVDCLAELHAFWWRNPSLGNEIGEIFDEKELRDFVGNVEKSVIGFIDFLGDKLSAEQRKIYEKLIAASSKPWQHFLTQKNLTVIHGDAHWWNFLYPHDANHDRVRIFDWHLWHVDLGARDLAFMIALGWYPEQRAKMEQNLLRRYYDNLLTRGVEDYSWDEFWDDYRWSAIRNLNVPVVQWSQGRSADSWWNREKALLAFQDLKCEELLID